MNSHEIFTACGKDWFRIVKLHAAVLGKPDDEECESFTG
jgi:hypothetical protein